MLRVNQLTGFGASASASVVFGEDSADTSNAVTYLFPNQSAGPAAANRVVAVGVWGRDPGASSPTCDDVDIGGINATKVIERTAGGGNSATVSLWAAIVATGTTLNVEVTFSTTMARCAIGVWAIYDARSATATDTAGASGDPSTTTALDIQAGGVAIGMAGHNDTGSINWTGALARDFDNSVESQQYSGASAAFALAETGPTITANPGAPVGPDSQMVVAAFR